MDPRDRADALLARARARRSYIVTPDDATSPMDAMNTLQIPRSVVQASDSRDEPEVTMSIPGPAARARAERAAQEQADLPTGPIPTLTEHSGYESAQEPSGTEPSDEDSRAKPRKVEGLIPTVQEPSGRTSSLVDRLRGHD